MLFPLFTFALESESARHFDGLSVLYTGVGKVNAALQLGRYLAQATQQGAFPSVIINCGTVGSRAYASGTIVQCHRFLQHDMDVTALGFAPYQTPFDSTPVVLQSTGPTILGIPDLVCGTGDHFVTNWPDQAPYDIVDMEAYALARVCQIYDVPFMAVKYVSDNADDASHIDWGAALDRAAQALRETTNHLFG